MAGYSCVDMPTVQQFLDSDAFMRGLMGPFGCLAGDTEFLTPAGWKRIDAYRVGDLVGQWDHKTGKVSFCAPFGYIREPCDDLILFDSGSLVMALSPEHSVPHYNWRGEFQIRSAAVIAAHPSRRTIPTTFSLSDWPGLEMSDDLIRFAVMMHADGHYPKQGKQGIIAVRKERKKQRIRQLLTALDLTWDERIYEGRPTETSFVFYPPYVGKHFTSEWYGANSSQLTVILDEIEFWDGLHDRAESVFTCAGKVDADFVQYAAHATGYRAALHVQVHPNERWQPTWFVRIRASNNAKNKAAIREHTKITRIDAIGGEKFCFTTQTGFFVARYRDTVFITGNSGKSSACAIEIPRRGLEVPPGPDGVRRSRYAVVRNTIKELEDTTERTVLQWLVPQQIGGEWTPSKHNYKIRGLRAPGDDKGAEIEIMFRALDRDDQIRDLLSLELTGAWVNEAREINWAIVEALQARVGRFPRRSDTGPYWFGIWLDTNPPDVDSEFFKFFEETDHVDSVADLARFIPGLTVDSYRSIFKQPSGRSPKAENLRNLAEGYYQRLAIGKSPEWIKVYIDGDYGFVSDGKPVWPEYVDQIHCPPDKAQWPKPVLSLPIVRSWDFGLCYSDDTEVLTDSGWKLFADVDPDIDLAASRNPSNGEFAWAPIAFKIEKDYEGDLIGWRSTEVDMLVTPEHRVPFTYRDTPDQVHFRSAQWLADHASGHHYVDLLSVWDSPEHEQVALFGMQEESLASFIGIYLAEGSSTANGRVAIYQANRDPEIQKILDATGLDWRWYGEGGKASGWKTYHRDVARYLHSLGTAKTKRVPAEVWKMSAPSMRALIHAHTLGDGHIRMRDNGVVEHTAFTMSAELAGNLQALAQMAGWNSSIRIQRGQRSVIVEEGLPRVIISSDGFVVTYKKRASRAELLQRNFQSVPYEGKVYCLNVPWHTLYVRRNGRAHWNGNTPACIYSQVTSRGQWIVFDEQISASMGADRFSDEVLEHSARYYSRADFWDIGDPAGAQRAQTDERTCFEILHAKNIGIEPGIQTQEIRLESVRKPLRTLVDGRPQFVLHPRCARLRRGMMGGYHFRKMRISGERYTASPEKDSYSHPCDALGYAGTRLFGAALRGHGSDSRGSQRELAEVSAIGRSRVTGY